MNSTELAGLVKLGLEWHRKGKLEQAGQIYGEVLAQNPLRSDALHLFGLVLYQLGETDSAIEAIKRAIALSPNQAHFHANLAEIYRSLGQLDRASGSLYLALKLRPDRFTTLDDFDILFLRRDELDRVQVPPRRQVDCIPPLAAAATEEGDRLRASGNLKSAVAQFFEAVRLAPDHGLLRSNLAQALVALNRTQEALTHAEVAVNLAPDIPETWNQLGNIDHVLGRSIEARSSYLEALRLAPDMSLAMNGLGRVLADAHYPTEALVWFRLASANAPKSVAFRANLAWILRELNQLDEAMTVCQEAIELNPHAFEAHVSLGSILHERKRFEDASRAFRRAVEINPDCVLAHQSQGILLTEMGDLVGAERAFREALRLHSTHSRALAGLVTIHRGALPEADLDLIQEALRNPELPDIPRAEIHFAASVVHDARQEYDEAAEHLSQANALRLAVNSRAGRHYLPRDHELLVEQMMDVCSAEFFERVEGYGLKTDRLVFIFGLPRSGTSLTEQILASHSRIHGLGETELIHNSLASLPDRAGSKEGPIECLARIDGDLAVRMAREHLDELGIFDGPALRIVDKLPDNYMYLGYLATLFPNARFIHCRRDLRDVAVSCWSTNFWYLEWTNSFDHIAARFEAYQRLMSHWESVLPIPMLRIDYEETVADLETTARRLVDWCGLDWEPTCLDFHKSPRAVRTASVTQVRQPIYRRSVDRWRNYEQSMGSLFDRLSELVTA